MMIGDARFDLLMGKRAGVKTCGVTYGNGTIEELAAANPDFLIDDIRELIDIVGFSAAYDL